MWVKLETLYFVDFLKKVEVNTFFFSEHKFFCQGDLKKKTHSLNLIDKHFTPEEINITML